MIEIVSLLPRHKIYNHMVLTSSDHVLVSVIKDKLRIEEIPFRAEIDEDISIQYNKPSTRTEYIYVRKEDTKEARFIIRQVSYDAKFQDPRETLRSNLKKKKELLTPGAKFERTIISILLILLTILIVVWFIS